MFVCVERNSHQGVEDVKCYRLWSAVGVGSLLRSQEAQFRNDGEETEEEKVFECPGTSSFIFHPLRTDPLEHPIHLLPP